MNEIVPEKKCTKCGIVKPFSEFHKNKRNNDGKCPRCRKCTAEDNKDSRRKTWAKRKDDPYYREQRRRYTLNYYYGITLEFYEELLRNQNGKCICGAEKPAESYRYHNNLFVDHDHGTGDIRGLLCNRCNHILGMVDDNPELLEKLAQYLRNPINPKTSPKTLF
jgi:hypothetical protein